MTLALLSGIRVRLWPLHCRAVPLFERLAKLIAAPAWLQDPRFGDDELRGQHGALISARVAQWCTERTLDEAFQQLGDAKIACGPVLSPPSRRWSIPKCTPPTCSPRSPSPACRTPPRHTGRVPPVRHRQSPAATPALAGRAYG